MKTKLALFAIPFGYLALFVAALWQEGAFERWPLLLMGLPFFAACFLMLFGPIFFEEWK